MLAIFIEHLSIELSMFKSQFYYVRIYLLLINEQQKSSLSFESKETKETRKNKKNIICAKGLCRNAAMPDEFTDQDGVAKVKEAGC